MAMLRMFGFMGADAGLSWKKRRTCASEEGFARPKRALLTDLVTDWPSRRIRQAGVSPGTWSSRQGLFRRLTAFCRCSVGASSGKSFLGRVGGQRKLLLGSQQRFETAEC